MIKNIYIFIAKKKMIFLLLLVITLFLLVIFFNNNIKKINSNAKLSMDTDYAKIIWSVAAKDGQHMSKRALSWRDLPLSKKFIKKYGAGFGILNDNTVDLIDYTSEFPKTDKNKQIVCIDVVHGLKEEEYYVHYTLNDFNELDDVEIVEIKQITDEKGREIDEEENETISEPITIENYISRFTYLTLHPYYEWQNGAYDVWSIVSVTEEYFDKYYTKGLIEDLFPGEIKTTEISQKSNFDQRIVYVKACNDEIIKFYKIIFELDDHGSLNDYIVEEINELEYK